MTIKYNEGLLCYNFCQSLLASQFLSDFCPIPNFYAKIPGFYSDIFIFSFDCAGNKLIRVPIVCLWSVAKYRELAIHGWGGGRVFAWNYSGVKFNVPIWGHITSPSTSPSPPWHLEGNIHGSCGIKTSRPLYQYGCWHNHIYLKWVPRFLCHVLSQIR